MEHGKFTTEKVITLEQQFELSQNPEKETKIRLASQLGLDLQQVVVWFQNRPWRARWKHEEEHSKLKNENACIKTENLRLKTDIIRLENEVFKSQGTIVNQ
nr:homeobox-leucine zipper protein ATHB-40-like [Tanacetum cinerariifolium]